jgi:iron complex transport system substrate-binding protein
MDTAPRIVSFLPSATEMVCALGLGDQLVGITHECDYPAEIKGKAVVVRNVLPLEQMNQNEIDRAVSERLHSGQSLYQIDERILRRLAPDLIITQDLCQVCAPSGNEVAQVLKSLPSKPEILWMTPRSIAEIFENIRDLGRATDRLAQAEELIAESRAALERIEFAARDLGPRPRVFCLEWIDPIYCSGHWVPEMVRIAGGIDQLGKQGSDSVRIEWDNVLRWAPDVLIIMPCGFNLDQVVERSAGVMCNPRWFDLAAVRNDRIYAVDANSYFARPGPRIVEGTQLLAHLIHPEAFSWNGSLSAFKRLEFLKPFAKSAAHPEL